MPGRDGRYGVGDDADEGGRRAVGRYGEFDHLRGLGGLVGGVEG